MFASSQHYKKGLKPYKDREEAACYKKKMEDSKCKWEQTLFDIACCKCENSRCCSKERKVPVIKKTIFNQSAKYIKDDRNNLPENFKLAEKDKKDR
ncbi:unnamed protein product [Brassicogethes aeneus]|uniref:Uncharacterized protein n=1 Tax=Brassicogethes aeneus TaxID=1431903 RepID=A0A9P0B9U9_BRAAE|nr:unnamed protein product [Brassicogethes aeneus]